MGRVKEQLLKREYKEMEKLPNENLKEYVLTIESEYKPQAYEKDNYYMLWYTIMDLRSLEPITITKKVRKDQINQKIPEQLAIIIHESNHTLNLYDRISYKSLINNGWLDSQYVFEAIPLKQSINSLNDLLIIPSTEKTKIYYLSEINDKLDIISGALVENGGNIEASINNIDKALDLRNYLAQH